LSFLNRCISPLGYFFQIVIIGIVVASLTSLAVGISPLKTMSAYWSGAFMNLNNLAITLNKSSLILFAALAVAIPLRGGLFNVGGEGQIYLGGLTAALVGIYLKGLPTPLPLIFAVAAGIAVGAAWGWVAGIIKVKRKVHEVVTTIMLNYVALYLVDFLVRGPFSVGYGMARTAKITENASLPSLTIAGGATILSPGIFFAVGLCVLYGWYMKNKPQGYEVRILGESRDAATYAGIDYKSYYVRLMVIGGMLAGLGGAIDLTGVHRTFYAGSFSGYGYDGLAAAFLSKCHPVGLVVASVFLASLRSADRYFQLYADISPNITLIIEAVLVFIVSGKYILRKLDVGRKSKAEGT